jgi:hypothetical protein
MAGKILENQGPSGTDRRTGCRSSPHSVHIVVARAMGTSFSSIIRVSLQPGQMIKYFLKVFMSYHRIESSRTSETVRVTTLTPMGHTDLAGKITGSTHKEDSSRLGKFRPVRLQPIASIRPKSRESLMLSIPPPHPVN